MNPCVVIEGGIGAGKSSFMEYFNKTKFHVIPEPLDRWCNVRGLDFVELLYGDPVKFTSSFQHFVLLTMLESHTKPIPQPIRLMERSVFSGRNVFMQQARQRGALNQIEYNVLDEWYQTIIEKFQLKIDMVLYLKSTPEVALQRVKRRARPGECNITLSYMEEVNDQYEKWLAGMPRECPVITINADESNEEMQQHAIKCQEYILKYFDK